MRRKTSAERDLATHETKLAEARTSLDERRSAESQARATRDEKLRDLRHDLGLGRIDEVAYERERTKVEEPVSKAEHERQRAEAVVEELSRRTADLSEAVATAEIAGREGALARDEAAVAEAAETLARLRRKRDESEEALALARRALVDARVGYGDSDADAAAETRAKRDRGRARWFARNPDSAQEPEAHLLLLIAEERDRMKRENEEYRERLRSHPDYVGEASDVHSPDGLREGEPFATVEVIGPTRR